jgi:DNA-binding MarR family transcriptional regulator
MLDRLEAKGYVRRVRDENDRRRVLVELTPLTRERMQAIWGPLAAEGGAELEHYSAEQLHAVIDYFRLFREVNERHAERIRGLRFD